MLKCLSRNSEHLLEREPVVSNSVVTAAYCAQRLTLEVEYYNGLVFRFHGVAREIGDQLFLPGAFDFVFRSKVSGVCSYARVGKTYPFLGG